MAAQPRRRFKIEPFKHKMEVDKGYADQTWSKLESAIKEINNHKTSGLSFEEVRGKRVFGWNVRSPTHDIEVAMDAPRHAPTTVVLILCRFRACRPHRQK